MANIASAKKRARVDAHDGIGLKNSTLDSREYYELSLKLQRILNKMEINYQKKNLLLLLRKMRLNNLEIEE